MGRVIKDSEIASSLAPYRGEATGAKSKIVSTNGCFDLLHVGHLRYLQAAKKLGDILIIALNSDASTRGLKGPSRPILPEDERAELLAGLACVDFVVLFDEPTPVKTLQKIHPDIHVKGGQYNKENLPETEALEAMGTDIQFLPMVEGRSTSWIIDKIRQ